MSVLNIAIDGPAGAGKSTIAKKIAEKLSYIYVDTGAMYRAVGYFVKEHFSKELEELDNLSSEEVLQKYYAFIEASIETMDIQIKYLDNEQQLFLNGENITAYIRSQEMGNMASILSANKKVRLHLVHLQQKIAAKTPVVMDGRDIGTYVLPEAKLKIYLTASSKIRAKRRFDELVAKGLEPNFQELESEIIERDFRDMNRDFAPLAQAKDAILLDSSLLSIEEVVEQIYSLAKKIEGISWK